LEKVAQELQQGKIELIPVEEMPRFIKMHPEKFSAWLIEPAKLPGRA